MEIIWWVIYLNFCYLILNVYTDTLFYGFFFEHMICESNGKIGIFKPAFYEKLFYKYEFLIRKLFKLKLFWGRLRPIYYRIFHFSIQALMNIFIAGFLIINYDAWLIAGLNLGLIFLSHIILTHDYDYYIVMGQIDNMKNYTEPWWLQAGWSLGQFFLVPYTYKKFKMMAIAGHIILLVLPLLFLLFV